MKNQKREGKTKVFLLVQTPNAFHKDGCPIDCPFPCDLCIYPKCPIGEAKRAQQVEGVDKHVQIQGKCVEFYAVEKES